MSKDHNKEHLNAKNGQVEKEQPQAPAPEKKFSSGKSFLRRLFIGGKVKDLDIYAEELVESPSKAVWNNFKSRKSAILGLVLIIFMILLCFIGPLIWPVDILQQDPTMQNLKPGYYFLKIPGELKRGAHKLSMGNSFGAGITKDGTKIMVWGELNDKLKAIPELEAGETWQDLACGNTHIVAVTDQGRVVSWGDKHHGLAKPPKTRGKVERVYAGRWVSAAIDDRGDVHYWGAVLNFELNAGRINEKIVHQAFTRTTAIVLTDQKNYYVLDRSRGNIYQDGPEEIMGHVVDVAATTQTVFALTEDGVVYGWGRRDSGLLDIPESIQGHVKALSGGTKHMTALLDDGSLESWGLNNYGQTSAPSGTNYKAINAGYHNTMFIRDDDTADGWGLKGFIFGTDENGRDIFRRLIYGGRMSLTVGAVAVIISAIIGIIIGGVSGYYGGWVDTVLMRVAEIVYAIPFLPLAMILSALIQNRISQTGRIIMIMVILGILSWPGLARLVRGQILAVREQEYVTAAKSLGIKESAIIFRHILPNVINVVLVSVTLSFATSILTESTLSFLGFGVTLPTPTWGNMVYAASNSTVVGTFWWRWMFPSLALAISTLSINMIGDALRDAIDPKSIGR